MSYWPLKARSVASLRVISNCKGVSCFFHSASVLRTFITCAGPIFLPVSSNSITLTVSLSSFASPTVGLPSQLAMVTPVTVTTEFARNVLRFTIPSYPKVKAKARPLEPTNSSSNVRSSTGFLDESTAKAGSLEPCSLRLRECHCRGHLRAWSHLTWLEPNWFAALSRTRHEMRESETLSSGNGLQLSVLKSDLPLSINSQSAY